MKYVFDIDGTICNKPEDMWHDGDYSHSIPKKDRIEKINNLYDEGHTIIYLTARGMGRYNNSRTLATHYFRELTLNQLNEWGCKFHELHLGKPAGDFYIEDRGVNANDFFKT